MTFVATGVEYVVPEHADVQAIVEQVWSSYLGVEEPLLPRPVPADAPFAAPEAWSAAVSITGGWQGTVTVEVAGAVARTLTCRMLDLGEATPVDEDVADAVGELVNMVGGNIKSLLPGPSGLTLPAVAAGRAAHASETVEVARLDAVWEGHPVRVSVHTGRLDHPSTPAA
jgi:chemotaxis protein CheX